MSSKNTKLYLPTIGLLLLLSLIGIYLYYFTDTNIFWGGFIAMTVFYVLIFYVGAKANQRSSNASTDEVMLAGRALPLWIAVLTMSATWVGGGFINGTAEAVAVSGLVWVQAPWGYALSLIVG